MPDIISVNVIASSRSIYAVFLHQSGIYAEISLDKRGLAQTHCA
ncbi:MAG: hypothetical protein VB140_07300 [Burkholderia sp.]